MNPLVLASLGFTLKQSFSSATPSNRFNVGFMVVEWVIQFVSIKTNAITQQPVLGLCSSSNAGPQECLTHEDEDDSTVRTPQTTRSVGVTPDELRMLDRLRSGQGPG